ncbi:MAG: alpha/beta hydrolase [Acidobacteria bacterium]|nr:MAG: alpha/beta hydrolase [Acidobacteriota bacterium]
MEFPVEFYNLRRKLLRGMIHRPAGGRGKHPGVVFFHGFTGDRMESHWIFIKCARALAREGIASLRFDFYGSGESEGDFYDATLQSEIADARAAIRFMQRQKGIDPGRLGLCGLSLGGCVAACVAQAANARALVLWSAVAHPAILQQLSNDLGKSSPTHPGDFEYDARLISARFLRDAAKVDPLGAIRRFRKPTRIIHPGKDATVPLSHAGDFLQASGASIKQKVIIPGADHTFTSVAWEAAVIGQTVEWFRRFL